ncbi:MMPL family transporter [Solirubrobacter ginsenosidimutans]|uniref:MMPL family transporter n=1 Tax=Solirubrobacter ginsenosidimutans TaxID=490573 RepID=A0A9X3N1H5_9ACTN|nr:MMPL family transporter [Solirubrobacter ginsenosidimutans]MDA0166689.1 MMPL family transporter [Solirubrobacter ginsenosidimutans]
MKWAVIAAWLVAALVAIPFQAKLQTLASDESDAFKDRNAESTKVDDLISTRFKGGSETTAVILYANETPERIATDALALCNPKSIPDIVRVITPVQLACGELPPITFAQSSVIKATSEDQTTQLVTAWTSQDATETVARDVKAMRASVSDKAFVTGEAGFAADQTAALEGIDTTLLIVTLALVIVLLGLIYRSPIVALVPVVVVGIAYVVAAALAYAGAKAGLYQATGQATAILIVLMFGAGTDYCLLLLSRYREEIGHEHAMRTALRRTAPAIVSAGGIVVAVMLVLGLAGYNATRWMGPVLAIGMAVTVLAGVTLLPAVISALGRFPQRKHARQSTIWPRIGALVQGKPLVLALSVGALLLAGALGNLKSTESLDFSEQFRNPPESVQGLRKLQEKFPPGQAGPVDVLVDAKKVADALPALRAHVYSADLVGFSEDGLLSLVKLTLNEDPFTENATKAIPQIRAQARGLDPKALVGGPTAEIFDNEHRLSQDAKLIVPLALALVFVIVAFLLRSLIAPIYVIATVLLSYAFALGVSTIVFGKSDPAQPLFTFVFLVALGVDYNIFLITRIREEGDVVKGLVKTGGVITSAGLILAGTFCTLLATELESLFQVGFTVALGLLVDTFLIRIFLVPSIALLLRSRAI